MNRKKVAALAACTIALTIATAGTASATPPPPAASVCGTGYTLDHDQFTTDGKLRLQIFKNGTSLCGLAFSEGGYQGKKEYIDLEFQQPGCSGLDVSMDFGLYASYAGPIYATTVNSTHPLGVYGYLQDATTYATISQFGCAASPHNIAQYVFTS